MVELFARLGAGQWIRYLTGALEVLGAVGLLFPRATFYGAVLLATMMVGAIVPHLALLGGNPTPAVVLFLITGTVAYMRRPKAR